MDAENLQIERASTRCSVCRLPDEVLANLHADRFEGGMGFEAIARKHALPDRPLSEAGVRRHFNNGHVAERGEEKPLEAANANGDADMYAPGLGATTEDDLDSRALVEAGAQVLGEMVQTLASEYRAAAQQRPAVADRAFAKFMKAHTELAKTVKQLEAGRTLRDEFRKTVPRLVEKVTTEAMDSIATLMREIGKRLREDFVSVGEERLSLDEFWNRLTQYENAWPIEIGTRMRAAKTAALKAEEARVGK